VANCTVGVSVATNGNIALLTSKVIVECGYWAVAVLVPHLSNDGFNERVVIFGNWFSKANNTTEIVCSGGVLFSHEAELLLVNAIVEIHSFIIFCEAE
jgi:hypothetical protein